VAARSIASLSLTFGLVSIPIKLYSATESSSAVKFKLMGPGGARVRQTYVADALPAEAAEPELAPAPETGAGAIPLEGARSVWQSERGRHAGARGSAGPRARAHRARGAGLALGHG